MQLVHTNTCSTTCLDTLMGEEHGIEFLVIFSDLNVNWQIISNRYKFYLTHSFYAITLQMVGSFCPVRLIRPVPSIYSDQLVWWPRGDGIQCPMGIFLVLLYLCVIFCHTIMFIEHRCQNVMCCVWKLCLKYTT